MDKGRFGVQAAVRDWTIALGVAALLLGTGLSGEHPDASERPSPWSRGACPTTRSPTAW